MSKRESETDTNRDRDGEIGRLNRRGRDEVAECEETRSYWVVETQVSSFEDQA